MASIRTQRVVSFFLAFFLLVSSIGAVALVVKQSSDQQSASDAQSSAASAATQKSCTVPSQFATTAVSSPADIQKIDSAVTGIQKTDIKEGTGEAVALNDCITVNYRLNLADGTIVEGNDSFATGKPIAFQLKEGALIEGWIQGIPGMKVGGIRRLVIPASLAYGAQGSCKTADTSDPTKCSVYAIAPNSDLVFDIELLDTQH